MALINFQKQFADDVESGIKTQTIRTNRKHPIKPGETLYLYTGLRTNNTKKLKEVECKDVYEIHIFPGAILMELRWGVIEVHDTHFLNKFAQADGFRNWTRMIEWFEGTHSLPFEGTLILW